MRSILQISLEPSRYNRLGAWTRPINHFTPVLLSLTVCILHEIWSKNVWLILATTVPIMAMILTILITHSKNVTKLSDPFIIHSFNISTEYFPPLRCSLRSLFFVINLSIVSNSATTSNYVNNVQLFLVLWFSESTFAFTTCNASFKYSSFPSLLIVVGCASTTAPIQAANAPMPTLSSNLAWRVLLIKKSSRAIAIAESRPRKAPTRWLWLNWRWRRWS